MFDREKVRRIRERLDEQLAPLAKELGMTIEIGNASFTANNINFKVVVAAVVNGQVMNREAETFQQLAPLFGLPKDALGKTFTYGGKTYRITGLAPRRSRFPILADRVPDGKGFKFPVEAVASLRKTD